MGSVSALASEVSDMAGQVMKSQLDLNGEVASTKWSGPAADRFAETAGNRSVDFLKCADALKHAAKTLSLLAAEVG